MAAPVHQEEAAAALLTSYRHGEEPWTWDGPRRWTRPGGWSVEDLIELDGHPAFDGVHVELVDGEIEVSPPPIPLHQGGELEIAVLLRAQAPPGLVVLTGVGVRTGRRSYREPDVTVARRSILRSGDRLLDPANVLLVAEVASPSTRGVDTGAKSQEYAAAGIPSYWRLELDGPTLVVGELRDGRYADTALAGSVAVRLELPFPLGLVPADLLPLP